MQSFFGEIVHDSDSFFGGLGYLGWNYHLWRFIILNDSRLILEKARFSEKSIILLFLAEAHEHAKFFCEIVHDSDSFLVALVTLDEIIIFGDLLF